MHSVTVVATELLKLTESVKPVYHVTQNTSVSSVPYNHFVQITI